MSSSDLWYPQRLSTIFCLKKTLVFMNLAADCIHHLSHLETWVVRPKDQHKIVTILLYFPFIPENLWVLFLFFVCYITKRPEWILHHLKSVAQSILLSDFSYLSSYSISDFIIWWPFWDNILLSALKNRYHIFWSMVVFSSF